VHLAAQGSGAKPPVKGLKLGDKEVKGARAAPSLIYIVRRKRM